MKTYIIHVGDKKYRVKTCDANKKDMFNEFENRIYTAPSWARQQLRAAKDKPTEMLAIRSYLVDIVNSARNENKEFIRMQGNKILEDLCKANGFNFTDYKIKE